MRRRDILAGMAAGIALTGPPAFAESSRVRWPIQAVSLICAYLQGGGTDAVARFIAGELEKRADVSVTTLNISSGAGADGLSALMRAAPDGGTLGVISTALITLPLQRLIPFTWRDIDPLVRVDIDYPVLVVPSVSPHADLAGFLRLARSAPKSVTIAHSGPGSAWHLGALAAGATLGFTPILLPREGAAGSIRALRDGTASAAIMSAAEASGDVTEGWSRVLGVMGPERSRLFSSVPTFAEMGEAVHAPPMWRGLALPRGVPARARERIRSTVLELVLSDDVREAEIARGITPAPLDDTAFRAFLHAQGDTIGELMRSLGAPRR